VCLSIQQFRKHIIALPYNTWIVSTKMQMLYNLGLHFVHYFYIAPIDRSIVREKLPSRKVLNIPTQCDTFTTLTKVLAILKRYWSRIASQERLKIASQERHLVSHFQIRFHVKLRVHHFEDWRIPSTPWIILGVPHLSLLPREAAADSDKRCDNEQA
jgi:hypothetical protein